MSLQEGTLKAALEHSANDLREILTDIYPELTLRRGRTRAPWRGGDGESVAVSRHHLHDFKEARTLSTWEFLTECAGFSPSAAAEYLKRRAGIGTGHHQMPQAARRMAEARAKARQAAEARLEAYKARKLAEALTLQKTAATQGTSDYLARKGVTEVFKSHRVAAVKLKNKSGELEVIPGLVYASDKRGAFIQLAIRTLEGELIGFQRIYDGKVLGDAEALRDKDFIGSTGGGFILLEPHEAKLTKDPRSLKASLNICEGFATGASVAMASHTKQRSAYVFCALSAGNLESVAAALRECYGYTYRDKKKRDDDYSSLFAVDITLWADLDKSGTGQRAAQLAALRFDCYVSTPRFRGGGFGDFNDLHQQQGLGAVKRNKRAPPDARVAFAEVLARQQLAAHKHVAPFELPPEGAALIVKAPQETGKTHQLAELLRQHPALRVLVVTHRESLAKQLADRLRFDCYQDYLAQDLRHIKRLVICFDSLNKLTLGGELLGYDLVILDESEQVLEHTTGRHIKRKAANFGVLEQLLKETPRMICADADAGRLTVDTLKRLNPARAVSWHRHDYHVGAGRTLRFVQDRDDTLDAFENTEGAAWYASDSLRHTRNMSAYYGEQQTLVINSETATTEAAKAYLLDPSRQATRYQRLIASPSVQTGLSDDSGHWQRVIGDFGGRSSTPQDAMQALMRARGVAEVTVHAPKKPQGFGGVVTVEEELEGAAAADRFEAEALSAATFGEKNANYERLRAEVEASRSRRQASYKERLVKKAALLGYEVRYDLPRDLDSDTLEARDNRRRDLKEAGLERYVNDRADAERIGSTTAQTYEDAYTLTQPQRFALEQYQLRAFYRLADEVSRDKLTEMLRVDNYKALRGRVERYEAMLEPREVAEARANGELEGGVLRGDSRTHMLRHDYHQRLAEVTGLTLDAEDAVKSWHENDQALEAEIERLTELEESANTRAKGELTKQLEALEAERKRLKAEATSKTLRRYSANDSEVKEFTAWCSKHYKALKTAGLVTCSLANLKAKPIENMNDSLRRCGLETANDSQRKQRGYTLELDSVLTMANYSRPRRENWHFAQQTHIKNQYKDKMRKNEVLASQTALITDAENRDSTPPPKSAAPTAAAVSPSISPWQIAGYSSLYNYVRVHGQGKTRAVLLDTFARADSGNTEALAAICAYLQNPQVQQVLGATA